MLGQQLLLAASGQRPADDVSGQGAARSQHSPFWPAIGAVEGIVVDYRGISIVETTLYVAENVVTSALR